MYGFYLFSKRERSETERTTMAIIQNNLNESERREAGNTINEHWSKDEMAMA
jgi:hypothetical protein